MQITKTDVLWNYLATFFKIASSAILLPVILHVLPSQEVGIWAIFSSISALVFLLDLGFNSSFARNVTYVFSGVRSLKKEGFHENIPDSDIQYDLLNGVLSAMKWFYSRVSIFLLLLLLTGGSWYISEILKGYHGDKTEIVLAWLFFCAISTYNLYTLYYDALLEGKGLIKRSKQITIAGNMVYLIAGALLVWCGYGLVALVLAQLLSIVLIRTLSYRAFFTDSLVKHLKSSGGLSHKEVLTAVSPNALKYGLTSFGGFMIQKSSVFIGSLFIALPAIASFGITKQLIDILVAVANITLATYLPQITKLRVNGDVSRIKDIYIKGILISNVVFILGATFIIVAGHEILSLLKSNTNLVSNNVMFAMAFSSLIGLNSGISGAVISTKNEIPFMKPSLYSGFATIVVLLVLFKYTNVGLFGMAIAPGLIDLCYQGWKWPLVVIRELDIKWSDVYVISGRMINQLKR